jgi:hypothetical protein
MVVWSMATFVEHSSNSTGKLPYFVELIPHLTLNDGGGLKAVKWLMKNWKFDNKLHIVTDR